MPPDDGGFDRRFELIRRTGLGEETKDLAFVHCRHGGVAARLAGEQDAARFRVGAHDALQEGCAVHVGHAHVGNDDGDAAQLLELLQALITA